MNFDQHALILAVIESLHRHGSWTGTFDVETALEQMKSYGAVEVEATASWIRRQERVGSADAVARRLNALKPHVSLEEAAEADRELMNWRTAGEFCRP